MDILKPGEKLIASTTDYTSGDLKVNDAYDLYLVEAGAGRYLLIVFMKLQFFFEDNKKLKLKWTEFEKNNFVVQWKTRVQSAWGGRTIKTLASGKTIRIDFRFETQIGGWMFDHWEITVTRVPVGTFNVSSVNPKLGNVNLDSEDFTLTRKSGGHSQRGVVHEFGHMLGIADEYIPGSPHNADYRSVMNNGEVIQPRHDAVYLKWVDEILVEKNIN